MRDDLDTITNPCVVRAEFAGGNSVAEVDAYPGKDGDGWGSAWTKNGSCTATAECAEEVDDEYYLHVTANDPGGAAAACVSRKYEIEDRLKKYINLGVYHKIEFKLRIDEDSISHLNAATDGYYFTVSDSARTDVNAADTLAIVACGDASVFGAGAVRKWAVINGDRDGGIDSVITTNVELTSGVTYSFTIDVNAEDGTYQVLINSSAGNYESDKLKWRHNKSLPGHFLNFIARCATSSDTREFSLDTITITQEPNCLRKPPPYEADCLCSSECTPCEFVPPNIDTARCVHPYIKLQRHDDLAIESETFRPWAHYNVNDYCMAGHETKLTCCSCFSWEYSHHNQVTGEWVEDYIVITYPWFSDGYPITIEGTENCSFHRTVMYQVVYVNYYFIKDLYLQWKQNKQNGSYSGLTRLEELAQWMATVPEKKKCFRQVTFGVKHAERNFRFQGETAVDFGAYFWLSPSPMPSFDHEAKLVLDHDDAGSVCDAFLDPSDPDQPLSCESVPGVDPVSGDPDPTRGLPGWTVTVLKTEEDLEGIASDLYAEQMSENMKTTAGGLVGLDWMIGTDCIQRRQWPPCDWRARGIRMTVSIPDYDHWDCHVSSPSFTSTWTGDGYCDSYPCDVEYDPLTWSGEDCDVFTQRSAFPQIAFHNGNPGTCGKWPCPYYPADQDGLAGVWGYRLSGEHFVFDRSATYHTSDLANEVFLIYLDDNVRGFHASVAGTESISWSNPSYEVEEYPPENDWDPVQQRYTYPSYKTISASSNSFSGMHKNVGLFQISVELQWSADGTMYLTDVDLSVSSSTLTAYGIRPIRGSLDLSASPLEITNGLAVSVPCEILRAKYQSYWDPFGPVSVTFSPFAY